MGTPERVTESEFLRTFENLRAMLDRLDTDDGWLRSSTKLLVAAELDDDALRATAHSCCSEGDWYKHWDCSHFAAIMQNGSCRENLVSPGECLADALRKMTELPRRLIHIAFHGAPVEEDDHSDKYVENTFICSYRIADEADLRRRFAVIPPHPDGARVAHSISYRYYLTQAVRRTSNEIPETRRNTDAAEPE